MVARLIVFLAALSGASCQFLNCVWVNSLDCVTYKPGVVCGSDGKDYPNTCYMAKAQCLDKTLHLKYTDSCANHGYTAMPTTPGTTREPVFINHNQLLDFFCLELMHKDCPTNTEQVCGTDNVTYDNFCEYEKSRCEHRTLAVKKYGMC